VFNAIIKHQALPSASTKGDRLNFLHRIIIAQQMRGRDEFSLAIILKSQLANNNIRTSTRGPAFEKFYWLSCWLHILWGVHSKNPQIFCATIPNSSDCTSQIQKAAGFWRLLRISTGPSACFTSTRRYKQKSLPDSEFRKNLIFVV